MCAKTMLSEYLSVPVRASFVRVVYAKECCPCLWGGVRQSRLTMVQEHGVARGRCGVPNGTWRVQFLLDGDEECHAVLAVGVVDPEAQLGVRDSIGKMPQYGFCLSCNHLRVDREPLAGGAKVFHGDGQEWR